jgi:hypothetical protein
LNTPQARRIYNEVASTLLINPALGQGAIYVTITG